LKKSKKQSGTEFEKYLENFFLDRGWQVHRSRRSYQRFGGFVRSNTNDVFGCIDLILKKKDKKTVWIQATKHSGLKQKIKDLSEVKWNFNVDQVLLIIKRKNYIDIKEFREGQLYDIGKIVRGQLFMKNYNVVGDDNMIVNGELE